MKENGKQKKSELNGLKIHQNVQKFKTFFLIC